MVYNKKMQNNNLKLNYKKPIVAIDGQSIFITDQGPVNLVFFQIREQGPAGVEADVVAAVRLHTLEELKGLQKLIEDSIKKHETREP